MISVKGLAYHYHQGTKIQFPDFIIKKGTHCLLLGESGSGKTTLLHLMGGLLRTQEGSIFIEGTEIATMSESALDHYRGAKLGFVFQRNHLISALTVEKNLLLATYLGAKPIDRSEMDAILERLGLLPFKHRRISALSYGQQQRLAIARSIVNKPEVIFADEPTSSLDDTNCERVIHLLEDLAEINKSTLVIATHDHRLKNVVEQHIHLKNISA